MRSFQTTLGRPPRPRRSSHQTEPTGSRPSSLRPSRERSRANPWSIPLHRRQPPREFPGRAEAQVGVFPTAVGSPASRIRRDAYPCAGGFGGIAELIGTFFLNPRDPPVRLSRAQPRPIQAPMEPATCGGNPSNPTKNQKPRTRFGNLCRSDAKS